MSAMAVPRLQSRHWAPAAEYHQQAVTYAEQAHAVESMEDTHTLLTFCWTPRYVLHPAWSVMVEMSISLSEWPVYIYLTERPADLPQGLCPSKGSI